LRSYGDIKTDFIYYLLATEINARFELDLITKDQINEKYDNTNCDDATLINIARELNAGFCLIGEVNNSKEKSGYNIYLRIIDVKTGYIISTPVIYMDGIDRYHGTLGEFKEIFDALEELKAYNDYDKYSKDISVYIQKIHQDFNNYGYNLVDKIKRAEEERIAREKKEAEDRKRREQEKEISLFLYKRFAGGGITSLVLGGVFVLGGAISVVLSYESYTYDKFEDYNSYYNGRIGQIASLIVGISSFSLAFILAIPVAIPLLAASSVYYKKYKNLVYLDIGYNEGVTIGLRINFNGGTL